MILDFENEITQIIYRVYDLYASKIAPERFNANSVDLLKNKAIEYSTNNPMLNVNEFPCLIITYYGNGEIDFTMNRLCDVIGLISNEG